MIQSLTRCQNKNEQEDTNTNVGSQSALYLTPVTVIGAVNGNKPTWTLVAHVGIIGHDRVLVSFAAPYFSNGIIKENKTHSINIVDGGIFQQADHPGSVSGAKTDKSSLFAYETGEAGLPIIKRSPLVMECTVVDEYDPPGFESFICTIVNTYVEEGHLNEAGKIDYHTLKPVLFEFPTYGYLKTGDVIGKCLSLKNGESI